MSMHSTSPAMDPTRDVTRVLRFAAVAVAALVVAAIAATPAVGDGLELLPGVNGSYVPVGDLVVDGCIVVIALVLTLARPVNLVGWLMLAFGGLGAMQNFAEAYGVRAQASAGSHLPLGRLALSLGTSVWIAAFIVPAVLLLNVYPSGRAAGRWTRWTNRVAVVATCLAVVAVGTSRSNAADDYRLAYDVVDLPGWFLAVVGGPATVILLVCVVFSVVAAVRRTARAQAPERQQLLLLLTSAALLVPLGFAGPVTRAIGLVLVPVAVAIGVLRFRLLGIDIIVRRTLLYGVLTGLVVGVYAATAAVVSVATSSVGARTVTAAALVALLLVPLRDRLQRSVDRVVYGARRDPLLAVRNVGTTMSNRSADPLFAVVSALASSIRAGYVAVVGADGEELAATARTSDTATVTYPLQVGGEHLAELRVAPTRGETQLDPGDARVVEALAVPLASVVYATQLTNRLAAASEHALAATHQERSRIRRDLHDGLGPSLSGVALGLEAIDNALPTDPALALDLTKRIRTEVHAAVEEIRRIIDALQPGALHEGDLVTALRVRADAITARSSRLVAVVRVDGDLRPLSPEVEQAAYRIVDEALTNVVRHAQASRCVVRIDTSDDLFIIITDDGVGMPAAPREEGVGLVSMRQRATELDGTLTFTAAHGGGTTVEVRIPLVDAAVAS